MTELFIKEFKECWLCSEPSKVESIKYNEDSLIISYVCVCGSETKEEIVITLV